MDASIKAIFENAWKLKAFNKDSNYMYMYSCEGFDYFKHSIERTYISVENLLTTTKGVTE